MNRRIPLIAGGVTAVFLVLWFMFLWQPQSSRMDEATAREEAAAAQNSSLEVEVARLKEVDANRSELVADQERLRVAVPDEAQLGELMIDINEAATESGVDYLSISPGEPTAAIDPLKPSELLLAIEVEGGYFEVLDYINRLDGMDRIIVIDTISVTPSDEDGEQRLAVSLSARTFTTAAPATAADGSPAPVAEAPAATEPAPEAAPEAEGSVLGPQGTTTEETTQ